MSDVPENDRLQNRIRCLEEHVEGLRLSRRVLMNLLVVQERERAARIKELEEENRRLHRLNRRFARAVLEKNIQISLLQKEVGDRREDGLAAGALGK